MLLEIFFAVVVGWIVFSYYSESSVDDILDWFKNIIGNYYKYDLSSENDIEEELENKETNEKVNPQLASELIQKKKINEYDELLDLAMDAKENDNKEIFENNVNDRMMPIPERNSEYANDINEFNNINNVDIQKPPSSINDLMPNFNTSESSLLGSNLV